MPDTGLLDLPWWGYALIVLGMTHITIAAVTIFLHRHQAHRALDLHPVVSHFFRVWLWMTTGMVTREWAAIHRKHHAKCETPDDPHSPVQHGILKVLFGGVLLYVRESHIPETIERYGHGTPDDWLERNVYAPHALLGVILMAAVDVLLFGVFAGAIIFVVQMAWIPFWAAGVINGVGHWAGYRNFDSGDASRNIIPFGILIGGEELHNNHHAYAASAKLSSKWYEFDIGWFYIRVLEIAGLATVKKVAPTPRFVSTPKPAADLATLHAVIENRYDVLSRYTRSVKATYKDELKRMKDWSPRDAEALKSLRRGLLRVQAMSEREQAHLAEALQNSKALATALAMRVDLVALWDRSHATKEQLLKQLQEWCVRAEESGVVPLQEFSLRLRSYA